MRKSIALLLALALLLSTGILNAFAEDEVVTFTALATYRNETYSYLDSTAFTATLEKAGINFEITSVSGSAWDEQYRLKLAGGDYPDVFIDSIDAEWYGAQEGILLPLEDLFEEYAPNLCAALDKYDGWDIVDYSDGHIYNIPTIGTPSPRDGMLWVNQTWLENLGLEVPQSFDEIYEVLKAFKEGDPNGNGDTEDEIPLVCYDTQGNGCTFMQFTNYSPYKFNIEFRIIIDDDGTVRFLPMTEEFKELIEYCTTLYQEGLMNEDAFTITSEDQNALVSSTDTVGMFFASNCAGVAGADKAFDWVLVEPWCDSVEIGNVVSRNVWCITDHCQQPELIIEWVDQFFTEEGAILAQLGVKGETYDVNEDGDWYWLESEDVSGYFIRNTLVGGVPTCPSDFVEYCDAGSDAVTVYVKEQMDKAALHGNLVNPQLPFTNDDLQLGLPIMIDVNSYFPQYMAQVMNGTLDLGESWDDFQAELISMGAPTLEEVLQGCYDRMTY